MLTTSKNSSFEGSYAVLEAKENVQTNDNHVSEDKGRTLGLLPSNDSLEDVINLIKKEGFTIANTKTIQFTLEQAKEFYADSRSKKCYDNNYYDKMENWLSSGSNICALLLEKENAVKDWRLLMGPANYKKARKNNPNSLRALFYKDASQNATHGTNEPLPHSNEKQVENLENGQINNASDTEKEQEKEASTTVSQDLDNKFDGNIDIPNSDNIASDVIKEEDNKINEISEQIENTDVTVSNESESVTLEDPETTLEIISEPSNSNDADNNTIETPIKATEFPSEAEQAENKKVEKHYTGSINMKGKAEVENTSSEEIKVKKDATVSPIEQVTETGPIEVEVEEDAEADPIENAASSHQEKDKAEGAQLKNGETLENETFKSDTLEGCQAGGEEAFVEEIKEDSTTATPSPELSEHNLTTTNSTDVDTEKEEDSQTNDIITKDLKEENTPDNSGSNSENIKEEALKKEDKAEAKTNNTSLKASGNQKTNSTKEPIKEIATSGSRIKPPSSINKIQSSTRSIAPTAMATRQPSVNKPSKAGTTRIARLSPSATLNTETPTSDKKKRVSSSPRDNGVPSVAKKAVTRVSKNLPRVALMAQKPPKTTDKNEEEEIEKKPKKRTSSTRSFISRLTTPTVASANKKTDSDTPAVTPTTPKRSSLPSKRSSTVRPMAASSKDTPLRNKQNTDAANNQPAKDTTESTQQLSN
ncbi:unnamed protein product [Mucor hiemalis]